MSLRINAEAPNFTANTTDQSAQNIGVTEDQIVTVHGSQRRSFLKALSGGVLGATAVAASIGQVDAAQPIGTAIGPSENTYEPLWQSAQVLIGNSPTSQAPSLFIECPLFFENGNFADGYHTLDLSNLQTTGQVIGTITYHNETITPNFGASVAATLAQGTDGATYLLVGGEGTISGGTGYFSSIDKAVIRCKYQVKPGTFLLISCVDCIIILIRS
jgi:hypothetical protein